MDFWQYLPLLMKLAAHRMEIERIQKLLAPAEAELAKVWPEVLPLIENLAAEMTTVDAPSTPVQIPPHGSH